MSDYLNNYMRKRTGGYWPVIIVSVLILMVWIMDMIFNLGWFKI